MYTWDFKKTVNEEQKSIRTAVSTTAVEKKWMREGGREERSRIDFKCISWKAMFG